MPFSKGTPCSQPAGCETLFEGSRGERNWGRRTTTLPQGSSNFHTLSDRSNKTPRKALCNKGFLGVSRAHARAHARRECHTRLFDLFGHKKTRPAIDKAGGFSV